MLADKPWTKGPFELISHAATHMNGDSDFDRRMALISLDNAIEVSICTFLHLHPQQRKGLRYKPDQIQAWLAGFHSLLDFLYDEHSKGAGIPSAVSRGSVIYYHRIRNEMYHSGNGLVPEEYAVLDAYDAARWIFCRLFEVDQRELDRELHNKGRDVRSRPAGSLRNALKRRWADSDKVSGGTAFLAAWNRLVRIFEDMNLAPGWFLARAREDYPEMPEEYTALYHEAGSVATTLLEEEPTGLSDEQLHTLADRLHELADYLSRKLS
jgi:hypothetical protein